MDRSGTRLANANLPLPSAEFLCRLALTALFSVVAHQFQWEELRYLTSEAMLRLSALLRMPTARDSFDTIVIQGHFVQFVASCTLAEMYLGSLPLIWDLKQSTPKNLLRLLAVAVALFGLNIVRLELGQIAYTHGVPWISAHDIPLGFAYFAVWVVVWRTRNWQAWHFRPLRAVPAVQP